MNKSRTYKDLLEEKQRLELELSFHKTALQNSLAELQDEFRPALGLVSLVGKITKADKMNPLAALGIALATDVLLKNVFLSQAAKVTRVVVPFLVKKTASIFAGKDGNFVQRIAKLWKGKGTNGAVNGIR